MFSRIVATFLFLCVMGFWSSSAVAGMHEHHHGQHGKLEQVVSPFDKKQDVQSKHCALKNHAHYGYCPHDLLSPSAKGFKIASDCGGKSSGTVPTSTSTGKNLFTLSVFNEMPVLYFSQNIAGILPSYSFQFADSLDPPPRFI